MKFHLNESGAGILMARNYIFSYNTPPFTNRVCHLQSSLSFVNQGIKSNHVTPLY